METPLEKRSVHELDALSSRRSTASESAFCWRISLGVVIPSQAILDAIRGEDRAGHGPAGGGRRVCADHARLGPGPR
jgi:hypothetical protein